MIYEGDFRLLNPFPDLRCEDGEYHCPMPMLVRLFDEDDVESTKRALCGEVLRVEWTMYTPVPDHDSDEPIITSATAGEWATWSTWKLVCAQGHALMTSADGQASEEAQPFDSRLVFGPWDFS